MGQADAGNQVVGHADRLARPLQILPQPSRGLPRLLIEGQDGERGEQSLDDLLLPRTPGTWGPGWALQCETRIGAEVGMSWDIAFDPASRESMGSCRALAARISALVPGIVWEESESWGVLDGEGFSIEFNLAGAETESFMIHVRGGNGCHGPLLALTGASDWVATDMGSGEPLDLAEDGRGAVVRMFCSFCDEERFARFMSELLWEAKDEGRLTEWQVALLEEFCSEFGISPVPDFKAVKAWPW